MQLKGPDPKLDTRSLITPYGVEKFLESPYIKGIGHVFAKKIVEKADKEILDPQFDFSTLGEIQGLGAGKIEALEESLRQHEARLYTLALLYSAGLSDIEVEKIVSHYGKKLEEILLKDPYDMVENAWKVSFFTADKLGKLLGIGTADPRRLRGALLTSVKMYAEKGHLYATLLQAVDKASAITGVAPEEIIPRIKELEDEERLIYIDGSLYLPVFYYAEKEAAEKIAALVRNKTVTVAEDYCVPQYDKFGHSLSDMQKTAIETVLSNTVTVITGGAGTGKTTTVKGIIEMFNAVGKKVVLTAPTGRSTKKLSELAGADAKTIHRLLGYRKGKGYFNRHLDADVLVIDEGSLLEQVMFNHLLDAIDSSTRLVIVGDTHQLPPIGAGDVLNDMIVSGALPVIELKENFRQKEGSGIAEAANDIKEGIIPLDAKGKDFLIFYESDSEKIRERLFFLLQKELPERYGVNANDVRVVTPMHEGMLGARQLNEAIQSIVNPDEPEVIYGQKKFRLGDRVMQISNSSSRNVFNGESGIVTSLDEVAKTIEVTFSGNKIRSYGKERFKELSLAYATTVHKLQGAEADNVIVILTKDHEPLLYRNLVYTAVSRAKNLCVLLGEKEAVEKAINKETVGKRNSNFHKRLLEEIKPQRS